MFQLLYKPQPGTMKKVSENSSFAEGFTGAW